MRRYDSGHALPSSRGCFDEIPIDLDLVQIARRAEIFA